MSATSRLPSDQRRAAIIRAVRRAFAERGFHGTTTKELAKAAGVSEALLFKHFPDKEALFTAMQDDCCREAARRYEVLQTLEPSSSTLVLLVHFLVSLIICDKRAPDDQVAVERLALRSLADDGEFARHLHRPLAAGWVTKVEGCVRAAQAAGEAEPGPVSPPLGGWLIHNLAVMVRFHHLPESPVVEYGLARKAIAEQAVWFALRGLGLKEDVIRRHYNPRALALFE